MPDEELDEYGILFKEYLRELKWAFEQSLERQVYLVKRYMDQNDIDEAAARHEVVKNHGTLAEHGHVIYVIRKYWLEVDRIKKVRMETNPDQGWLEPMTFLYDDLEEEDELDLADMLSELTYWPIGIDPEMNWC